jgi:hypothetical protein
MGNRNRVMPLRERHIEIELEDCLIKGDRSLEIKPGDLYLGERNVGPKLLTCWWVNKEVGCVFPKDMAYPYDISECVKVTSIDGESV